MQKTENITFADADGGGTIDTTEFATLLARAGGGATSSSDAAALFAAIDADGDGELTEDEIKQLADFKRLHRAEIRLAP